MGTLAHDDAIRGDAAERVHHDLEQDVAPDTTSLERVGILGLGTVQELGRVVREPPRRDRVEGLQDRSEEHTSELQSRLHLVCRLLLVKKKKQAQTLPNVSSTLLSS